MTPSRRSAPLALLLCLVLAAAAFAQVTRMVEVKHRRAEELAPLVETALAGEGRVVADRRTNLLMLSGTREGVQTALALIARLDVRQKSVLIRYESRTSRELTARGASVLWNVGAGGVRIGNVRWPSSLGVAVQVADGAERRQAALSGQLRVLDGQSGRIATGSAVPVPTRRVVDGGRRGARVVESTQYVSADSGFEARPRVLGDGRVELALRPFEASVRADGRLTTSGADTIVLLEPGKTVALGGILRESSGRQTSALSGAGASAASDESLLLVTVDVE
jgi:type II secretory pathway component GspD/PulD (secretin)